MKEIIDLGEKSGLNNTEINALPLNKGDLYQSNNILCFINNQYFTWTCLVLLLNYKKWKRPVVIILFLHWFLRCIGDCFFYSYDLFEKKSNRWPHSNNSWLYSYGVASIFWYFSEIIGDWYPLLRTTAIIKNKGKLKMVFITCFLYNFIKIIQMFNYLTYVPFRKGYNIPLEEKNYLHDIDEREFKFKQWINVAGQQIFSLLYDLAVIRAFKKNIFNNINNIKNDDSSNENRFLYKFKIISEYRIYLSMIITVIGIPFIFGFTSVVVYVNFRNDINTKDQNSIDDSRADFLRRIILNLNYNLMYIDQILLRFFVEQNINIRKNYNSSSNTTNSSNPTNHNIFNFNMVYHDFHNYNDYGDIGNESLINNQNKFMDSLNRNENLNIPINQEFSESNTITILSKYSYKKTLNSNYYLNSMKNKKNNFNK